MKQKQPGKAGKDEPREIHIDKVCVIAERGQEPEPVPKSKPDPDQELFRDIKSERGPGQKRDRETASNGSTKVCHPCYSKSTDPRADYLNWTPDAKDNGGPDERSQIGKWALTTACPNYA